jgi:hypothetical protein
MTTERESEYMVQIAQDGTFSVIACEFDASGSCSLDQLQKLVAGPIELINPCWVGLSPRPVRSRRRHVGFTFGVIVNEEGMGTLENNAVVPALFGNILIGIDKNGSIGGFSELNAIKLMQDVKKGYTD